MSDTSLCRCQYPSIVDGDGIHSPPLGYSAFLAEHPRDSLNT